MRTKGEEASALLEKVGRKMANIATAPGAITAQVFAEGLLASLAAEKHDEINATQSQLHKAFRQVVQAAAQTEGLSVDLSDVDYDPLYGLSGWLDEFLARAQRDLMISRPNPSYSRIHITLDPEEAEELLGSFPNRLAIKTLSEMFWERIGA